jgi:hypothetical protein
MTESVSPRRERAAHWDSAYRDRGSTAVSWYQPAPTVSIELIHRTDIARDAAIIDIGGGASGLVDALLADGFCDVSVLDVSGVALDEVRQRLASDAPVTLIHGDLLHWSPERSFDLWHDRAVFHFLVDEHERATYLRTLRGAVHKSGFVILGTFAPDGPSHCSGLRVARYSGEELSEVLGPDFEVRERLREEHVTPAGVVQPFTWLVARRR